MMIKAIKLGVPLLINKMKDLINLCLQSQNNSADLENFRPINLLNHL